MMCSVAASNIANDDSAGQKTPPFHVGFAMSGLLPNGWLSWSLYKCQSLDPHVEQASEGSFVAMVVVLAALVLVLCTNNPFPKSAYSEIYVGVAVGYLLFALLAFGWEICSPGAFSSPMIQAPLLTSCLAYLAWAADQQETDTMEEEAGKDSNQGEADDELRQPLLV